MTVQTRMLGVERMSGIIGPIKDAHVVLVIMMISEFAVSIHGTHSYQAFIKAVLDMVMIAPIQLYIFLCHSGQSLGVEPHALCLNILY